MDRMSGTNAKTELWTLAVPPERLCCTIPQRVLERSEPSRQGNRMERRAGEDSELSSGILCVAVTPCSTDGIILQKWGIGGWVLESSMPVPAGGFDVWEPPASAGDVRVLRHGLVYPLHVVQTAPLHWEAKQLRDLIRMNRPETNQPINQLLNKLMSWWKKVWKTFTKPNQSTSERLHA